jgi:hypothetical protein
VILVDEGGVRRLLEEAMDVCAEDGRSVFLYQKKRAAVVGLSALELGYIAAALFGVDVERKILVCIE